MYNINNLYLLQIGLLLFNFISNKIYYSKREFEFDFESEFYDTMISYNIQEDNLIEQTPFFILANYFSL
jgi:hypothetical protein